MQRPGLAILGWVAATLVAVGVAHGGVSAVAGRVVDPLPPTLGLQSVAERTDATIEPSSPSPSPRPPTPSPTTTASAAPTSRPSASPSPPPPDPETSIEPTPAPEGATRSYALVGGSATLRFQPGRVTVVAAEPAQGFRMEVEGNGTAELRVEFDSDAHRSRLRGWWEGGARDRIDEDVRDEDVRDDDDDEADDD